MTIEELAEAVYRKIHGVEDGPLPGFGSPSLPDITAVLSEAAEAQIRADERARVKAWGSNCAQCGQGVHRYEDMVPDHVTATGMVVASGWTCSCGHWASTPGERHEHLVGRG